MCAIEDRSILVEAETLVRAGIPGSRPARVPPGLVIVLPLLRADGDLVVLRLSATGGRLTLTDDGNVSSGLSAADLDAAVAGRKALLAMHGLRRDASSGDVVADIPDLSVLCAKALAMGHALVGLGQPADALELAA